jgi:hypothetical protein
MMTLFPKNNVGEKCLFSMSCGYTNKKKFVSVIINAKDFPEDNRNIYTLNLSYDQVLTIINDLQASINLYHKLKTEAK